MTQVTSEPDFNGKVVFITGAGTGIGRTAALSFARQGAKVAVAGIPAADVEETARLVSEAGGSAIAITCDVRVERDIQLALDATVDAFGHLDIAFNNAGVEQRLASLEDLSWPEWQRNVDVNLTGVYLSMKHELPLLRAAGGGSIVNTSSGAGVRGIANQAGYAAAKWGVIGMTKSLALEVAAEGIRVNAVCPGIIDTPMARRTSGGTEEGLQKLIEVEPVGRMGLPEEVVSAVLWLSSDLGAFVTGHALVVDGGMTI